MLPTLRFIVVGLLLGSCRHRGPDLEARVQELIAVSDAAWEERGALGLDEAAKPLLAAWSASPHDPDIAWRLARWRLTEGLVSEDPGLARGSYAQARELALECLDADPLFSQRRLSEGWVVALASLTPDRSRCAAWAALAWARWIEGMGGGAAAIDLDAVDALVDASQVRGDAEAREISRWGEGILAAARPVWAGQDLEKAQDALLETVSAEPRSVVRRADLYRLVIATVGTPQEQEAAREKILSMQAVTPEDVRAKEQVAAGTSTEPIATE